MGTPRVQPRPQPWPEDIETAIAKYPRGPGGHIALFRTLAHSRRTLERVAASGVLDKGSPLTIKQREILILRTSARCDAEYEWGIHVLSFAERAGLGPAQVVDTCAATPNPGLWCEAELALFSLADQLHIDNAIDDALWQVLNVHYGLEQVMEMLRLCGSYHTIAYFINAFRIDLEPGSPRFPSFPAGPAGKTLKTAIDQTVRTPSK